MSRFEYLTECPECSKLGVVSHLGFQTDDGKIACDGETVHEFTEMPGESASVTEEAKPEFTRNLEEAPSVPEPAMTPQEEAALDAAMATDPRPRDFGSQVVEAVDEGATAE